VWPPSLLTYVGHGGEQFAGLVWVDYNAPVHDVGDLRGFPAQSVKAAPLRSAAPGHARTGLRPWGADPARRAGHPEHDEMIGQAHRQHHSA